MSLARSGEYLVTVVGGTEITAIGVDVELDAAAAPAWVAREAVAKALGTGLGPGAAEPREFDGELLPLVAPDGFVAALALLR